MLACMPCSPTSTCPGSRVSPSSIQWRICCAFSSGTPSIVVITSTGNGAEKSCIESIGIGRAEVLVDLRGDHLFLRLNGAWREDLVEQAAHVAMIGRVHEDDRLRRPLPGPHHRKVDAVGRRILFEIL